MASQEPKPVGELDDGVWTKTVWIPQIDGEAARQVERLKQDLDLEAVAARDGHQNLPAAGETALNATQLKICDQVFHEILMLNEFLAQEIGLALKRARPLVPPRLDGRRIKDQMGSAIEGVFHDRHGGLVSAKLKELEKMRELKLFRFTNMLSRGANEKLSGVKTAALILVVFLLESMINGSLLSEVMSGGLLQGATFAGFISLINIGTGLIAGFYGWRYLGHRKAMLRFLIGLPIMLAMHAAAIGWNLVVAHFREVAEAMAASASFNFDPALLARETLAHIGSNGIFGVTSLQSLGLLLLGIIIHFLAAKEGWDDLSDRYPDYSKVQVAAVEAHEAYEDAMADTRDQARAEIEVIEARAQDVIARTRRCCDGIAEMIELAAERRQEVRNSEDKCVAAGTQLLKTYREINCRIRDEGTAPAYFRSYPTASDYRNRAFGGSAPSSEIREQEQLTDSAIQAILAMRDQAASALEEAESALKDISRGVATALRALDLRIDAESKKVEKEAERRYREQEDLAHHPSVSSGATQGPLHDPA